MSKFQNTVVRLRSRCSYGTVTVCRAVPNNGNVRIE